MLASCRSMASKSPTVRPEPRSAACVPAGGCDGMWSRARVHGACFRMQNHILDINVCQKCAAKYGCPGNPTANIPSMRVSSYIHGIFVALSMRQLTRCLGDGQGCGPAARHGLGPELGQHDGCQGALIRGQVVILQAPTCRRGGGAWDLFEKADRYFWLSSAVGARIGGSKPLDPHPLETTTPHPKKPPPSPHRPASGGRISQCSRAER